MKPYFLPILPKLLLGALAALLGSLLALAIPQVFQYLVDGPILSGDRALIWLGVGLVFVFGALDALMLLARRYLVLLSTTGLEARLRTTLYRKLQDLPAGFHDRWPAGQLLSRSMTDLSLVRQWFAFGFVLLVANIITVLVGLWLLFTLHWLLGTVFFLCCIPIWVMSYFFERSYSVHSRRSQDQAGDLATLVEESVHGIRVLKSFGRAGHALSNFRSQAERLRGTELAKAGSLSVFWMGMILVPSVAFALCLVLGGWLVAEQAITLGVLFTFFGTATALRWPIESLGFLLSLTLDTRNSITRVHEVLDEENPILDAAEPRVLGTPRGELAFDDVHFRYPDAPEGERDLLDGVSLRVAPGETVALVGLAGSGKTVMTALVSRFYDVTGGAVRLDGIDVRELSLSELRGHVAVAFEDPVLFSESVRYNVLLGNPQAEDAVLREALEVAQAEFVAELPEGLDTQVGEEGHSLSGGQRQRLALARVVAAKPRYMMLDDPLSALDVSTEAKVEAALRRVLEGTTALVVAHRPSTVLLADRVAVLKDGRIVGLGTHAELLAANAHYRHVITTLEEDEREAAEFATQPIDILLQDAAIEAERSARVQNREGDPDQSDEEVTA